MFIDTSAVIAILAREPDAAHFARDRTARARSAENFFLNFIDTE
jgi:uncharacterized protein with PIN domain